MHHPLLLSIYRLAWGATGLALLIALTPVNAWAGKELNLVLFLALSLMVKRAGFHVLPQVTHSLVGLVDLAALLAFGPALGGWVAGLSAFVYLALNALRHGPRTPRALLEVPTFNLGLKAIMALASGAAYQFLGGAFPLDTVRLAYLLPLAAMFATWFALDHIGWGLAEAIWRGWRGLVEFYRSIATASLAVELLPLPFAAVIATLYAVLALPVFLVFSVGLIVTSLVVQRLADMAQARQARETELAVLNEFGAAIASAGLDESQLCELIYTYTQRIVSARTFLLGFIDADKQQVTFPIWVDNGTRQAPLTRPLGGLTAYLCQTKQPLLIRDMQREQLPVEAVVLGTPTRSALFVPLLAGEEVIGEISVQSLAPNTYSDNQARLLAAIAHQAAMAIEKARLYARERYRAKQLELIAAVSRRVAAILDLDKLLEYVAAMLKVTFGYYHVDIYMLDAATNELVLRAGTAKHTERLPCGPTSLCGWVAQSGEAVLVNDVSRDPRFMFDPAAPLTKAELAVPLRAEERLWGVLEAESDRLNAFGEDDLFVLKTLADQIAVAINEAQLYAEREQEAWASTALLQVAEAVGSLSDLDEILETIVRLTPLLVGVEHCLAFLWDAAAQRFSPAHAYGLGRETRERFQALRLSKSALGIVDRLDEQTLAVATDFEWAQSFGLGTPLMLPLLARGVVMGALVVDAPTALEARRMNILNGIAHQAAVAIENWHLQREAVERERLREELRVAYSIQSSLLPEDVPVVPGFEIAARWQPAQEVAGDFYDFIALEEGRWGLTIADVADKGVPAALYMTLARTVIRAIALSKGTRRRPRQVLERANDILIADARADMFVTAFHGELDATPRVLTFTNAGHNPPLWIRRENQGEWSVASLKTNGMALGVVEGITLEDKSLTLNPGDCVVLYTDGAIEARNSAGDSFGAERLARTVVEHADSSASALLEAITRAITEFTDARPPEDDVTLVVVKCVNHQQSGISDQVSAVRCQPSSEC